MHDLIIIGGGPAAVSAGVYAARKKIKTLVLAEHFNGQSSVSSDIQNWIGDKSVSGENLNKRLKEHLFHYQSETFQIKEGAKVTKVEKSGDKHFQVTTANGETFEARAVLVASGASRRRLSVPGAAEFEQKGITYCASCDGPVFADKDVAVIGGGNAAFETAMQLAAYCKSVTLIEFNPTFKADKITVDKVLTNPKIKGITNAETIEFTGDKFLKALKYKNRASGEIKELEVEGVFVEIGFVPATDFAKGLVDLTDFGAVAVDHRTQRTSVMGIWAAGDCTDVLYHQNNIAVGDAIKALEDIYFYLNIQ